MFIPQTTVECFSLFFHTKFNDYFKTCVLKCDKFIKKTIQEVIINAMSISSFASLKVFYCKYYKPQINS